MNGFKTIMNKELTRVFKDRKMIFSMFVLPLVLVIGIYMLMFTLISNMQDEVEQNESRVYIVNAPKEFEAIVNAADNVSATYIDGFSESERIKNEIKEGSTDLLVEFPDDFLEAVSDENAAEIPQVKTYYNPSEENSEEAKTRIVDGCLEMYRAGLITEKFGSTQAVLMFNVDSDNDEAMLYNSDTASAKMLGTFVPYLVTMLIFAGAMGLGIDSIAGEKERGTMASLLLAPVNRIQIVMGKIAALCILSIMSAAVYVVAMLVAIPFGLKQMGDTELLKSLSLSFSGVQIAEIVIFLIGTVLMYVTIIALISVMSKNIKEAQSYISPVYIVVIIAGMITMYTSDSATLTECVIPVYNISVTIKGIFIGNLDIVSFVAATVVTYGFTAVLLGCIVKAFKSEKIMLNA